MLTLLWITTKEEEEEVEHVGEGPHVLARKKRKLVSGIERTLEQVL
jgi:hypothetical protein